MKHLREYDNQIFEASTSQPSVTISDLEFTYKGQDFMVSFDASANLEYQQPQKEEGHGFHEVGGGYSVEDIIISNLEISVSVLDKYVSIYEDPEIEEEITNFMLTDKDLVSEIEEKLVESLSEMEGDVN